MRPDMLDSLCNYSVDHYRHILKEALELGYEFSFFDEDVSSSSPLIFLRHDIDFSLEQAEKICIIENNLKIKSTYFILLNSLTYNPQEKEHFRVLEYIIGSGHRIGLHIEYCSDFYKQLRKQVKILELITDTEIKCFSLHNPDPQVIKKLNEASGNDIINVYDDKFTKDIAYISDSNQRTPCLCNFMKNEYMRNTQVLTHPLWWQENAGSCNHIINSYIEKENDKLIEWFRENNRVYANEESSYI